MEAPAEVLSGRPWPDSSSARDAMGMGRYARSHAESDRPCPERSNPGYRVEASFGCVVGWILGFLVRRRPATCGIGHEAASELDANNPIRNGTKTGAGSCNCRPI